MAGRAAADVADIGHTDMYGEWFSLFFCGVTYKTEWKRGQGERICGCRDSAALLQWLGRSEACLAPQLSAQMCNGEDIRPFVTLCLLGRFPCTCEYASAV
mmetsp:Transcript_114995/g.221584  ORF Transcript_114995/g.221584 Transcript_114995/m.221584 type:complete len:100 (+) Transcript_114995:141-440(+)